MTQIVVTCQCDTTCPSPNSRPCKSPITGQDGLCDYCRLIHARADNLWHCHTCTIELRLETISAFAKMFRGTG
jgi:hypothetical protein